jgi:sporulation protein YlmC with PRC-barrel domain
MVTEFKTLISLNDTDLTTSSPEEDIRDRDVLDSRGEKIGHVKDLFVDEEEQKVRFFEVAHGGFLGLGEERILVPVDSITEIDDDGVHIDRDRDVVAGSPVYDPDIARAADYYDSLYGHYGVMPYWSAGYSYPAYPYAGF